MAGQINDTMLLTYPGIFRIESEGLRKYLMLYKTNLILRYEMMWSKTWMRESYDESRPMGVLKKSFSGHRSWRSRT